MVQEPLARQHLLGGGQVHHYQVPGGAPGQFVRGVEQSHHFEGVGAATVEHVEVFSGGGAQFLGEFWGESGGTRPGEKGAEIATALG